MVASLLDRKIKSFLLLRDPDKAVALFGKQDEELMKVKLYSGGVMRFLWDGYVVSLVTTVVTFRCAKGIQETLRILILPCLRCIFIICFALL